jgi:hypothetical protein
MNANADLLLDAHRHGVGPRGDLAGFDPRKLEAFAQPVYSLSFDLRSQYGHRF